MKGIVLVAALLAAPTIAVHGTTEQKERYIHDTITGQRAWRRRGEPRLRSRSIMSGSW